MASPTNTSSAVSATTSAPIVYHYEPLKDEPSTKKTLKPRKLRRATSTSTNGGGGSSRNHQDGPEEHCLLAPCRSESHAFAFAEDILHEVELELQAEAEAEADVEADLPPRPRRLEVSRRLRSRQIGDRHHVDVHVIQKYLLADES